LSNYCGLTHIVVIEMLYYYAVFSRVGQRKQVYSLKMPADIIIFWMFFILPSLFCLLAFFILFYYIFVREHGVHAGPKDYFVVVVVIRGSI
jgi:hypothetical protein